MSEHLIIDHGNTRVKVGFFSGEHLLNVEHYVAQQVDTLFEQLSERAPDAMLYAATATNDEHLLERLRQFGEVTIFNRSTPLPFSIDYDSRESVGADRLANMAAAQAHYPDRNVLVVDLGTCVTYDLLTDNTFVGGAISPGLLMRMKAMQHFTSRLPLVDARKVDLVGRSTKDALRSGGFNGWNLEVQSMIHAYQNTYAHLEVVLTGGDLTHFDRAAKSRIFADPYWTLKGYSEILRFNAH